MFHPRLDIWDEHFELDGPNIIGKSPIGEGTIRVLQMNAEQLVNMRAELILSGDL